MSDINDGGPAFPVPHLVTVHGEVVNHGATGGMSLRDYFAASVEVPEDMMGWIAEALMGEQPPRWTSGNDFEQSMSCAKWWATARARYRLMEADAMLAERAKKGGGK